MINTFLLLFRDGVRYVLNHPQLLFTLLLIVVIPAAFILNAQQFLNLASENQERLERERIGLLHDVFEEMVRSNYSNAPLLQDSIDKVVVNNPDITNFKIGLESPDGIIIIAARDPAQIGLIDPNPDAYNISRVEQNRTVSVLVYEGGNRSWQSFRVVSTNSGAVYYLFTESSTAYNDALFASRVREGYYWLFGLLAVVLLLVLRHVRLIDYGYLYREAKRANDMKDLFTNMIAHELRAPLTAMRGYASLIHENESIKFEIREQGKRIEESAKRLVVIVNDLLDVARIQSGKMSVVKETVNVSKVVVAVAESLQPNVAEKGIALTHSGTNNDHLALSDEKRLFQALTNLVSNSIKYTESGGIEVAVENLKDRVQITVKDTGMGIDAANQKKLFAPFFRVNSEDVSNITGTGLGMWITQQLVELMGGSIDVESIRGVGTHVVVTLPTPQK
jgi:signal transduction histidine kinase